MFNNRLGNIKFLVATDAVGMGLNLNIQRVVFSTVEKTMRRGKKATLDEYTIKQIGGRAGRYTQDGQITAFTVSDLQHIKKCIGLREKKGGSTSSAEQAANNQEADNTINAMKFEDDELAEDEFDSG